MFEIQYKELTAKFDNGIWTSEDKEFQRLLTSNFEDAAEEIASISTAFAQNDIGLIGLDTIAWASIKFLGRALKITKLKLESPPQEEKDILY